MFGLEVSAAEQHLFALPLRLGGLGICDPVSLACHLYDTSVICTDHLIQSIVSFKGLELDSHFECVAVHKVDHQQCMRKFLMMSLVKFYLPTCSENSVAMRFTT